MNYVKCVKKFTNLFLKEEKINDNIIRYFDDNLSDMYDHNFFEVKDSFNNEVLNNLINYQINNNSNFIKIVSNKELVLDNTFDFDIILSLIKDDEFITKENKLLSFSNIKDSSIYAKNIFNIEKRYYGKRFGYDFCTNKMNRYLEKALNKNTKLNYYVALINNEVIGYCYSFFSNNIVMIDDLLVIKKYRNSYVASNLIEYIYDTYKCPLLLHASDFDTPKNMYFKLGFKEVHKEYEYFKKL